MCLRVCFWVLGRGLDDLMTVNLARYRPTGEHVAIRRIDLESCTNDMVTYLQVCICSQSRDCCVCSDERMNFTAHNVCNSSPNHISFSRTGCNLFFSASQGELHVSKLFHHPSILPYKSVFIAENELWVISPFMAYGKKQVPHRLVILGQLCLHVRLMVF